MWFVAGGTISVLLVVGSRRTFAAGDGVVRQRWTSLLVVAAAVALLTVPETVGTCAAAVRGTSSVEASFFLIVVEVAYTLFGFRCSTAPSLTTALHIFAYQSTRAWSSPCNALQLVASGAVACVCAVDLATGGVGGARVAGEGRLLY